MKTRRVLSVYPNHWGVGFGVLDGPDFLVDFGVTYVQPADNLKSLERIKRLLALHQPDIIVTRAFSKEQTTVSPRVRELVGMILKLAQHENLSVRQVSRYQIQEHFSQEDCLSKYDISQTLIKRFPALESYAFPVRKRWMGEHHYVGIFDAVAMVRVCSEQ